MTTAPLPCRSAVFLHVQDGLLAEEDEELPFAGHVVGIPQHFHFVEDFVFIVFVWTQEVVVGNPECQVIVGAVDAVKAVCRAVRSLIGAVEPFAHLFKRAVFRGDGIAVGKSDDLGDPEGKVFSRLFCEFHGGEWIGAVAVSDEPELFRELRKSPEGHAHGKDTGADTAVIGYLVADDGAGGGVHDEPDIGFDAADFDVGLISSEHVPFFIGVLIHKGFDADSGGPAVVGDLLVGDRDAVKVFEGLGGFPQGESEIDVEGEAQGHDMCVMLTEPEGGSVFRQGI